MKNKRKQVYLILAILFLVIAVICLILLIKGKADQSRRQQNLEDLAGQVNQTTDLAGKPIESTETEAIPSQEPAETDPIESNEPEEAVLPSMEEQVKLLKEQYDITVPEKTLDFDNLRATVNQDIYAWIYVPDTKIDYPVVQHPTDNAYYLDYNYDGTKGYPGCIYTENYNSTDFLDRHTVIYGHNMKNGTMFANLHKFEDKKFFTEHPYVYIYTEDRILVYEIFAAHQISSIHLLLGYDWTSDTTFLNYLEDVLTSRSMQDNLRTDTQFTVDSKIVTLSTCVPNRSELRYVVQGVLLNENY